MVQSQFKSPEALAHEEGDSLGSVMGGFSSALLKVARPYREG